MARIILIDDDPETRELLEHVLISAGFDVLTADEGRIGLAFSRAAPIDLLITDLVMPGMEGTETIRRFRKEFPGVPIIAMSGLPNLAISGYLNPANVPAGSLPTGELRTLAKPFQMQELVALVNDVLPPSRSGSPAVGSDAPKP